MKKLKFFYYIIVVSLLAGCGSDDDSTSSDSGIIADFSFISDGSTFTFTNLSEGATSYKWDFGDLYFYCDKENPVYTYTKVGGEIQVTLTAMNDLGQESQVTKTIIAPELIEVDIEIDGDFDDWEDIDVLYDESDLGNSVTAIQKIKMWGLGDYINIYLEGNANMQLEDANLYFNTDGDSSTGFLSWQWSARSGADYAIFGSIIDESVWAGFFLHVEPSGGWDWNEISGFTDVFTSSGLIIDPETGTRAIEFSIAKDAFVGIVGTIGFAITDNTAGIQFPALVWDERATFIDYEIPVTPTALCE